MTCCHSTPYHTIPHNTMLWCTAYHTWDGIPCCTLSVVSLQCIIPCCIRSGQKLPNHPQHKRHPMQNRGQTMSKRELLRTTRHYQIGPIRGRWTSRECNGRSPLHIGSQTPWHCPVNKQPQIKWYHRCLEKNIYSTCPIHKAFAFSLSS